MSLGKRTGFAVLILLGLFLSGCGATAKGLYRLPYVNDTEVEIRADAETHIQPEAAMYDMRTTSPPGIIVAAAAGWVRFIEDSHTTEGSGPNNYVWIEHPYPYCQDPTDPQRAAWPGKPDTYDDICIPCEESFCNEWTVYAHFVTGTVSGTGPLGAGLEVGDWVEMGQALGFEGAVGQTDGRHLHWFVAVIDPAVTPDEYGYYQDWVNNPWVDDPELVPAICHSDGLGIPYIPQVHQFYTATSCD